MVRVIGVLVILLAIAGIVAYSQGWITISGDSKNVTIGADIDKAKQDIKADINAIKERAQDVMHPKK